MEKGVHQIGSEIKYVMLFDKRKMIGQMWKPRGMKTDISQLKG